MTEIGCSALHISIAQRDVLQKQKALGTMLFILFPFSSPSFLLALFSVFATPVMDTEELCCFPVLLSTYYINIRLAIFELHI